MFVSLPPPALLRREATITYRVIILAIINLYSKRQRQLRGDVPDVYSYDELPDTLRTQIIHIWLDTLGNERDFYSPRVQESYALIVDTLCREYGVFKLTGAREYGNRDYLQELVNFMLAEDNVERALDAVELSFRVIDNLTRDWNYLQRSNADELADEAIIELNGRFKEHSVGFQLEDGWIIRIDSEFLHSEVIKPALRLLNQQDFAGVQQEFLQAHEHYRHGNTKEALNECLKAFESIMKSICDKNEWPYNHNANAKTLIDTCLEKELIPAFWQSHFTSLRSLLESGVPTGRNKLSGHGQGSAATTVPDYLVAYMIHMTASTLVFLGEADASLLAVNGRD